MAEVKTGMGRGILRFAKDGPNAVPVFTPAEQLVGLVNAMSLTPDDDEIFAVSEMATKVTVDSGSPAKCIELLLTNCEANWRFSSTAASCAVTLSRIDAMNSTELGSFRAQWLKKLQSLFSQKDNLRTEQQMNKWLSCIALLSQTFVKMLTVENQPLPLLVQPVCDVLETCLSADATNDELECAAVQLLDIGQLLSRHSEPSRQVKLQNMIRERIINGSGLPETRLRLISVMEGFASKWR